MGPWASHLTSLGLNFLIYKIRKIFGSQDVQCKWDVAYETTWHVVEKVWRVWAQDQGSNTVSPFYQRCDCVIRRKSVFSVSISPSVNEDNTTYFIGFGGEVGHSEQWLAYHKCSVNVGIYYWLKAWNCKPDSPGFESWLCYLLSVWFLYKIINLAALSSFISKIKTITSLLLEDCYEDWDI